MESRKMAQQIMRSEVIWKYLSDTLRQSCAAHGGKMSKIGIDDKSGVPLSVALITARIWTSIHSTVSSRACFYVFTNSHS